MICNLIGVVLHLRPQVHEPVVNGHVIFEPVIMRIDKVHLADQAGQIAVLGEVICHCAVTPVQFVSIRDRTSAVRVKSGQQRHPRRNADRVRTIGITEPDAARGYPINVGRWNEIPAGAGHQVGPVLIGHNQKYIRSTEI